MRGLLPVEVHNEHCRFANGGSQQPLPGPGVPRKRQGCQPNLLILVFPLIVCASEHITLRLLQTAPFFTHASILQLAAAYAVCNSAVLFSDVLWCGVKPSAELLLFHISKAAKWIPYRLDHCTPTWIDLNRAENTICCCQARMLACAASFVTLKINSHRHLHVQLSFRVCLPV